MRVSDAEFQGKIKHCMLEAKRAELTEKASRQAAKLQSCKIVLEFGGAEAHAGHPESLQTGS